MPQRIVVTHSSFVKCAAAPADALRQAGYELSVVRAASAEEYATQMAGLLPDAVGVVLGLQSLSAEMMDMAPKLRAISRFGVGTDNVDLDAATARGIIVTNTPGANATAVAELALGLMLDLARRISLVDRRVRAGQWRGAIGWELSGKTLGVVGAGAIGRRLIELTRGFDMKVLAAVRMPSRQQEWADANSVRLVDLETLLRESDFVSLHVPLTPETRRLIGAKELAMMKPRAALINTSRGGIVDEDALAAALKEGTIGGAGLDVFEAEPLESSALAGLDNVVLTSHIGGATEEGFAAMAAAAAANILEVLAGGTPAHVVNTDALSNRRMPWE
jgi:D-3-phosphoglycerate dehydrogenase